MPPTLILLLALATLLLRRHISPAVAGGGRRALHEPLFPIEWTPPPPPAPDFASDPATPATSDGGFISPAPPQSPTTVAADVSSTPTGPTPRRRGGGAAPKATIVVASAAAAAVLALLAFACAFLLTGRIARRGDAQKLLVPDRAVHRGPACAGAAAGSTSAPAVGPTGGGPVGSPYRKLRADRARRGMRAAASHPSPELRPLPPLRRAFTLCSTEEDAYYMPQQRSAASGVDSGGGGEWSEESASSPPTTTPSRRSLPSLTSDFFPPSTATATAAAPLPQPPPRSRGTPPRTRFSTGSAPELKQMISPSPRLMQPSNLPPPPPPPPPPPMFDTARKPPPPPQRPSTAMLIPITPVTANDNGSTSLREGDATGDGHLVGDARPKLKPLHWDKVLASSHRAMAWDQLKSNSFQLDEDMIETLFVHNTTHAMPREAGRKVGTPQFRREERVLDPKKAQNIAILLRALNVTLEEVSDALLDGNAECLGTELLETLVKMAPTKEEELKLRDYSGDLLKLGSAEHFLKSVLDIPFAFKRVDVMLYRANFETEINYLRNSFETLEAACEDLRGSRLFLKLLEAVLRTGNRMNVGTNRGEAKAFKLDTLLKLADIKGTDGKTTLLHFVVQEIIRSEDTKSDKVSENRKQGLKVVSGLSSELGNVKKAASMDFDVLHGYVSKLETGLEKIKSVLQLKKQCVQVEQFFLTMQDFLKVAEREIEQVRGEERRALGQVKEITEYFHGDAAKEEAHPLRIFMVVRDFLLMLDHVCREVGWMQQDRAFVGASRSFRISAAASLPAHSLYGQQWRASSSDEDSSSL